MYSTEIKFNFIGTPEELEEAQVRFHNSTLRRERYNQLCNRNSIRGIRYALRKKHGDSSVSVLNVLQAIFDNGYLDEKFLMDTFQLTINDINRALTLGIVPPSIKVHLSEYFELI